MRKRNLILCCGVLLIAQPACALIINVAPNGSPDITLTEVKKNPQAIASLERALVLIKSTDEQIGARSERITLQLAPGVYRLTETLKLDTSYSGSDEYPITIQGPKGGSAIISGGRAIQGFVPVTEPSILGRLPKTAQPHVLQTNLPQQGISDFGIQSRHGFGSDAGNPTALEITYQNQPMQLARWPNQGFATITTTPDGEKGITFTLQGANLDAWKNEPDLLATGYWFNNWADTTLPIKAVNPANSRITLTVPKPPYGIKAGQRVFIQNALAELDQPSEWYLDTNSGMLYVWLPEAALSSEGSASSGRSGFSPTNTPVGLKPDLQNNIEVSLLDKLLVIDNAHHITLNNLTFQSARGDAITVQGGDHITIAHSTIRNIGNRAAVISGQDSGLTDMLIENIGEGAIVLQGGDRQTLTPANLYAERSTIRRFARTSRTYQPAVLLNGVGNRAVGNTISDSAHTAILFTGNDHLISKNEIFNVCQETGDAGVIYTGRDWTARGTIISQNNLHNIPANILWGRTKGIYLDDQASGIYVRDNLFDKVDESVFIGGGRDNVIEGNTFLQVAFPIHIDARGKYWKPAMQGEIKSTMQIRLEAVPYNRSPYKDRYRHLENILEDEPGMPKYNSACRNVGIGENLFAFAEGAEGAISIECAEEFN